MYVNFKNKMNYTEALVDVKRKSKQKILIKYNVQYSKN